MGRFSEGLKDAAARACVLPLLLAPIVNPDLFWHLVTAGRILSEGRLPRDDAFSYTRMGTPWVDFEWLFQLAVLGVSRLGGWRALWGFKMVLWALLAALVEELGRLSGGRARARLLLVAWCAASLGRAELKPELFSMALFLVELWTLEAVRRGRHATPSPPAAAGVAAAFFALWANLHAGFAVGLALLGVYAAFAGRGERAPAWAALAAGAAGTLANPYGWAVWGVLADHARWLGTLSSAILEWRPLNPLNTYHVPQILLLAAAAAAAAALWLMRRPRPGPLWAAAAAFGVEGLLHARDMTYAVPLLGLVLLESASELAGVLPGGARARRLGAGCLAAAAAAFLAWRGWVECLPPRAFDMSPFPAAAADFVARAGAAFAHRRVYNEWGWGGYLEWRFGGEQRVFYDGRYIFHPLLAEERKAEATPRAWADFMDRHGVEWALIADKPRLVPLPGRMGYVEHYRLYFNDGEWALVHRDGVARVYVRRAAFDPAWTAREERSVAGSGRGA